VVDVFYIKDAGLTQVPEGSLTCVGFKGNAEIVESLKLL